MLIRTVDALIIIVATERAAVVAMLHSHRRIEGEEVQLIQLHGHPTARLRQVVVLSNKVQGQEQAGQAVMSIICSVWCCWELLFNVKP